MDLVGFLRFSLLCLDFLAWPTFALGYPIWQSMRAIETGSKYHMRKLVIYWTIFSLISLLEHTFKLFQWVPFWPYIKLIAICWLVIPCFNGASHVYQGLIHPYLYLNLQTVVSWFCWPQDKAAFLTSVVTYFKDNGSEALEKLIRSKGKHKEYHVTDAQKDMERVELTDKNVVTEEPQLSSSKNADARGDIRRVELTDKNTAAEGQSFKHPLENLAITENKTTTAAQVPKLSMPMDLAENKTTTAAQVPKLSMATDLAKTENKTTTSAQVPKLSMPTVIEEKRPLEIPAVKKVQREWTCAVCQVTASCEANLNSHFMGKKHKTLSEELKTGKQTAKNVQSSTSRATDSNPAHKKPKNCLPGEKPKQNPTKKPKNVPHSVATVVKKQNRPHNAGNLIQHSNLWCSICNIRCPGETDMAAHLNGRKHLCQVQSLLSSAGGGQD